MTQYPIADKKSPQNVPYSTEMVFSDERIVRLKITIKAYLHAEKRKRINPTPSLFLPFLQCPYSYSFITIRETILHSHQNHDIALVKTWRCCAVVIIE